MPRNRASKNKKISTFRPNYLVIALVFVLVASIGVAFKAINHAEEAIGTDTQATATIQKKGYLCESFSAYCVDTPNFNNGTAIYGSLLASARTVQWDGDGGRFCWNSRCYNTGVLRFPSQTNKCIVAPNTVTQVGSCNSGAGYIWAIGYSNGHVMFINRFNTQQAGRLKLFSGTANGSFFTVENLGLDFYFQKFDFRWN